MGPYHYDILEPEADINNSLEALSKVLAPLYHESWEKNKRALYKKPFNLHIQAFSSMWLSNALRIFVAYNDNKEAVGFLTGIPLRPLPYEAQVFQIEDWYAQDNDSVIEQGLFDHVVQAVRFMGCDEIWVSDGINRNPSLGSKWHQAGAFTLRRYVKG